MNISRSLCVIFIHLVIGLVSFPVCSKASGSDDTLVYFNGYASSINGEVLPYFSIYPKYAREALLTRCTDGKKPIEWNTDAVPEGTESDFITFRWIAAHSSGTSSAERSFDLFINDVYSLTFSTTPKFYPSERTATGVDSASFTFRFMKRDGAEDSHGMAYLKVPRSQYTPGKPLRLRVVGHAQNSNDWFMTFRYTFTEKVDVRVLPFLLKPDSACQPLRIISLHFGKPDTLAVIAGDSVSAAFPLVEGFNVFDLRIPVATHQRELKVSAQIGNEFSMDTTVMQRPVIRREIGLIHHSHTDIGYSHIQQEVIRIHIENIRKALRMIDSTKNETDGSAFVWNIESSWAAENFLAEATPEEKSAFLEAVRSGKIGLSATYLNVLTGLSVPEEFNWLTYYSRSLRDSFDLPLKSAMLSDIPGVSWNMVAALSQNGVRYFSNGPNYMPVLPDGGDRIGHTLKELGDKPFWWISPNGKDSLLFWTCAKGYSSWHGITEGAVFDRGAEKIAEYLDELVGNAYPYDLVQWRYNIVADNGPVDRTVSSFVKDWNSRYASPQLIITDVSGWFERFEKSYGKQLPAMSGDFTPYWEDGAYSTAAEETRNRELVGKMVGLESLASGRGIRIPHDIQWQAEKHLLLFHEHTWGSWNSITDPDAEFTRHQWEYKKHYLDSSEKHIKAAHEFLKSVFKQEGGPDIFNPSPYTRDVILEVDDSAFIPDSTKIFQSVEAFSGRFSSGNGSGSAGATDSGITFKIHPISGAISSLVTGGREWVDTSRFSGLLEAFHLKGLDTVTSNSSWLVSIDSSARGISVRKTSMNCQLEGTRGIVFSLTTWPGLQVVRLTIELDKSAIREKESIHIPLPFKLDNPVVRIGIGDTFYIPGRGQLKAANKDFYSVQRWIDVSSGSDGVTIASPQGALFEVGEVVDERRTNKGYKTWIDKPYQSSTLYLYALNNYWHTNFKADQQGKIRFDLYLDFHGRFDFQRSMRFGETWTVPPVRF